MISVITVAYNAESTIADSLSSISYQSVKPQHIIIDGASNDTTLEIAIKNRDSETEIISEPDNGIYDAMNKGLKLVKGSIIGFLNADDLYASTRVLGLIEKTFEDSSVAACYGDLCYVDSQDTTKITRYWRANHYTLNSFYWGWMPPHPTFFVRKEIYDRYGLFNLDLGSAADYELMLRFLLKHKVKARYIPEVLVNMRVGGISSRSFKNRLSANRNDKRAWRVNDLRPYPWTLLLKPMRKIPQWFVGK